MAPDRTEAVLCLAQATRHYGNLKALDRVDLELTAGEVYALVGRNGAGKSTLAKAAIGALALDAGSIQILGKDPARDHAVRRVIGVAPQEVALYPHLTIAENLQAFAALAGLSRGERDTAIARAMQETVCAERADERLGHLSGGWQRRANLAAAIVHRPRLLILDEPSEGLDIETRLILHRLIARLREDRTAILLISHHTEDVAVLANRLGVMEGGRLIAEGRPDELMAKAFGGRREITIRLSTTKQAAESVLKARGLASSEGGLCWRGTVADGFAQAREIEMELLWIDAPLRELAVRSPGLDALIGWATGSVTA
jgi:ABC-2 type transport system ATP-binding protein